MKKLLIIAGVICLLQACAVARTAGSVAIGTGQVALGAAQVVL